MSRRVSFSRRQRLIIALRDGLHCRYCGSVVHYSDGEIDHIHPLARGGSNHPENLAWSCRNCNRVKSTELWQPSPVALWRRLLAAVLFFGG